MCAQSIPSQGDTLSMEVDYKGKEFYAQLNILHNRKRQHSHTGMVQHSQRCIQC